MNKRTRALTEEEYEDIITTMKKGFSGCRPNERVATALVMEANLGLRISDILRLKLNDIVRDGYRYRLNIVEKKTGRERRFTVPMEVYNYIKIYCLENGIKGDEKMFPITSRAIQKQLKIVCDYLELENVSTHSFRKFFATQIYVNNDYNIVLVQHLLQHSNVTESQKYIGIEHKTIEDALKNHVRLL